MQDNITLSVADIQPPLSRPNVLIHYAPPLYYYFNCKITILSYPTKHKSGNYCKFARKEQYMEEEQIKKDEKVYAIFALDEVHKAQMKVR